MWCSIENLLGCFKSRFNIILPPLSMILQVKTHTELPTSVSRYWVGNSQDKPGGSFIAQNRQQVLLSGTLGGLFSGVPPQLHLLIKVHQQFAQDPPAPSVFPPFTQQRLPRPSVLWPLCGSCFTLTTNRSWVGRGVWSILDSFWILPRAQLYPPVRVELNRKITISLCSGLVGHI